MDADWRRQESPAAGVAQRLVWRTNRLRCMTHEEIGHRVLRALAMQAQRWGLLRSVGPGARSQARAEPDHRLAGPAQG
jgi:hypothetical protein